MKDKTHYWSKLLFGGTAAALAELTLARLPAEAPEPSSLSLIGVAVVAAIIVYRLNRRK